jgi:rsbT co-antagonist protein RsbR
MSIGLGSEDGRKIGPTIWSDRYTAPLTQCAAAVLQELATENRSSLPPFRLPQVAKKIIAGLASFLEQPRREEAATLGNELGQKGLALRSLSALGTRVMQEAVSLGVTAEQMLQIHSYLSLVTESLVAAIAQELSQQRDSLQNTLERALRDREEDLRRQLQALSTPIMPIHDGILVLPLIGQIDVERTLKISERLLEGISAQRARIVIIDVTGVPTMDREVAMGIVRTVHAAQLLGTRVVLVGVRADLAATLVQLGADLDGILTLKNLRSGIEYALAQQGLLVKKR